jgi:hypothetical protein
MPIEDSLFYQNPALGLVKKKIGEQNVGDGREKRDCRLKYWTLYFDGSKSQEGSRAGYILIDHKGKRHFL